MTSPNSYKKRPSWHPDSFIDRRYNLEKRALIIKAIRNFFDKADFLEVDTAALQVSPGMEPHLKSFVTELLAADESAGEGVEMRLHSSPEFAMKKLLVAGLPRIFQMSHVFRNGESSATHHPEFTMLEWYRSPAPYEDIIEDCQNLLRAAAKAINISEFSWQGKKSDVFSKWQKITIAEAFKKYAQIDLMKTHDGHHAPCPKKLAATASKINISTHKDDSWEDIFFRIMAEKIEPNLGSPVPTILYQYPANMASLSRLDVSDSRFAERFELYINGMELANAFGELNDATEQRRRFAADQKLAQKLYGVAPPLDEDFLKALEYGMPAASGIALGIDRLTMLATGANHIEKVLWLPVTAAQKLKQEN